MQMFQAKDLTTLGKAKMAQLKKELKTAEPTTKVQKYHGWTLCVSQDSIAQLQLNFDVLTKTAEDTYKVVRREVMVDIVDNV